MNLEQHAEAVRAQIVDKIKARGTAEIVLLLGVTPNYIYRIRCGDRCLTSLEGLDRFAAVLGVDTKPLHEHAAAVLVRVVEGIKAIGVDKAAALLPLSRDHLKRVVGGQREIGTLSTLIAYAAALKVSTDLG